MKKQESLGRNSLFVLVVLACLCLSFGVSAAPSEVQQIYNIEVAKYRSQTFYPVDLYLKQLQKKYEAEIRSRELLLPTFDEVCQEAKKVAEDKKSEIISAVTAKYSGASLINELNQMTQNSIKHPKIGNFDIIRRVAPNVRWDNWEVGATSSVEAIVEQMQEEYKRQAYKQLDGDNALAQIEKDAKKKFPLIKVGSRVSLELVGGTPASRRINQMYLTTVNSDSIILNNGLRKIRRSDLSVEDQARIFKDAHDEYIAEIIKQGQQVFWGKVNKLCEQEISKNLRDVLLENGYIPNPQKNNPLSSFEWAEKASECWTPKKNYVTFMRDALIAQHISHEMNTTFLRYMHDNGYVEIAEESAKPTTTKYWITKQYKDFIDWRKGKEADFKAEKRWATYGVKFAIKASNGELILISAQEAYIMEIAYMAEIMQSYLGASYQEDIGYYQLSENEALRIRAEQRQTHVR